jgi:hypothetical protein
MAEPRGVWLAPEAGSASIHRRRAGRVAPGKPCRALLTVVLDPVQAGLSAYGSATQALGLSVGGTLVSLWSKQGSESPILLIIKIINIGE